MNQTKWKHPTGGNPTSVMIVALGPTKHNLLELTTKHRPDCRLMDFDELWGLNGGVNWFGGRVQFDMLWVMDYLDGEAVKEPEYAKHIKNWIERYQKPVMTSQAGTWGLNRHVHEYPIERVNQCYDIRRPYYHNSLPYMIAYAGFIGVKTLTIYGADYAHEALKGREEDRSNAEYWIGRVEQAGVTVQLPAESALCNANKGHWYYGYRDQPK